MKRTAIAIVFGTMLIFGRATNAQTIDDDAARALKTDESIGAKGFVLPEHLEATIWAKAPMFYNPTNIDVDQYGRVWVTEAVNYRSFKADGDGRLKHEAGDRVVVLEDTDHDGTADKSTVFVQDPDLVAPTGIAVFDNRVLVSCSPSLIAYTDVNRNGRFEADVDKKEVVLAGFGGFDHDHGLHAVVAGPDGRWYFTVGNAGPHVVTDRSGWTLRAGGWYTGGTPYNTANAPGLKSDDGRVYVGGLAMTIEPDGGGLSVYAHNFRNNYEVCLDSFGNVFQNDNDDQVVTCRTTWLMQYANAGYSSADGKRSWQADRRPDQSTPIAHWHQEDPGVLPYGDLYGAGSPTGMVVYEGEAFGNDMRGMLLSCEAGRNVVFGYHVRPQGAGFDLQRFSFFSSGSPDDPDYKWNQAEEDRRKWFRPSDVAVGTDGAIYVADWFDPIVGGHAMQDRVGAGTIYRIAPKGRILTAPKIDLNTIDGQIAAFSSPAPNVRFLGYEKLRAQGDAALVAVTALRDDDNPCIGARAVWLMAQLGDAGREAVIRLLDAEDPGTRIVAFRALRRVCADVLDHARRLANDSSLAVRREVALAMRDMPLAACQEILLRIADGYDGQDRWYLEAFGTGCEGKEEALYPLLQEKFGAAPAQWDERFAGLVWRLHPTAAIDALATRALCDDLTEQQRKQAVDALAFIENAAAAEAMIEIATRGPDPLCTYAAWWVRFRSHNLWRGSPAVQSYAQVASSVPTQPQTVTTPSRATESVKTQSSASDQPPPALEELLQIRGDAARGRELTFGRGQCATCHLFAGQGKSVGPDLTGIGRKLDRTRLFDAMLNPSAAISFGYETWVIETTDGRVLTGFIVGEGDPVVLIDAKGEQQIVPADSIEARQRQNISLMPEVAKANLSPQELADIVEFLVSQPIPR